MRRLPRPDDPRIGGPSSAAERVTITGLAKSFGAAQVLRGVDLSVPAGALVALLGPSGCGKTTLLRCVAGLERPDSGEVRVGDRVLSGPGRFVAPERRRVGMVFQDAALFPHLSVARNVAYGLPRAPDRARRAAQALDLVGLAGLEDRMPATLSGGQAQRVAIARALAPRPSVILLDEPFSNLDAPLRAELRLEVRRVLAAIDATALFVTHDQEEAFLVGDEVAVMGGGAIAQQGDPTDLYELPATREVAEFIGDANFVPGVAAGGEADTPLGVVPLHADAWGDVEVMLRPERLIARPGDDATVERIEYYGHDAVYVVALDGGGAVRSRVIGTPSLEPGARVSLEFTGAPTVAYPAAAPAVALAPEAGLGRG
jgi:iron(III) transport system ATP-binding protein